jgi:hypothetical protein
MDEELRKLLDEHTDNVIKQYPLAGVTPETVKCYLLSEMAISISGGHWEACCTLLAMARTIENPKVKADVLNDLLVMPGHELHQELTLEIQRLKSASSVPYIRSVLEGGFDFLAYTCSEDEVIAKWFSHALAKIGTPEAIEVIKEFSVAGNAEIAKEMRYRLGKLAV